MSQEETPANLTLANQFMHIVASDVIQELTTGTLTSVREERTALTDRLVTFMEFRATLYPQDPMWEQCDKEVVRMIDELEELNCLEVAAIRMLGQLNTVR